MVIETDVRMRARDGVELAADVYRPDDDASHPVLLHRTPYDKSNPAFVSALIVDPVWLARCGYVVVVQDVRGRFASGGDYDFFVQEYDDGYDAVEWAATQPWSNGHVGIYGSSYHAMTTYQAVAARPPHLHAAAALVGAAGLSPTVRPGGCFELGFLASYLLAHSLDTISRLSVPETEKTALVGQVHAALADPMGTVAHLPIADLPVLGDGLVAPAWKTWIEQEPDSAYWQCDTLLAHPERVAIPVLHVAGVMDFLSPTMLELFEATQHDGRQRLVLGPWTHYGTYTGHVGARDYRSSAGGGPATLGPLIGSWFDRWLHDTNPAPDPAPVVRYFISGENRWHNAPSWPPATAERVYYLTSGGHANTRFGDGILGTAQPAETRSDRFRSDPLDPVPSHGGMLATPTLGPDGVQDQREIEERADVLVYTSGTLAAPLRIAGRIRVAIYLQTSVPDADIVAKLLDVSPSGYTANVSEGALRARYRHGRHDDWLAPTDTNELLIELHQAAHAFAAGHRIRLEITGSNFPRLSRNLHTRVLPEHANTDEAVVAEHTIAHGQDNPSRLLLPTLPEE